MVLESYSRAAGAEQNTLEFIISKIAMFVFEHFPRIGLSINVPGGSGVGAEPPTHPGFVSANLMFSMKIAMKLGCKSNLIMIPPKFTHKSDY